MEQVAGVSAACTGVDDIFAGTYLFTKIYGLSVVLAAYGNGRYFLCGG